MINDTVSMINPPVGWITGGSLITITAASFPEYDTALLCLRYH